MSRSVDLFIQSSLPIDELAPTIGGLIDRQLSPGPSTGSWVLSDGESEAVLRAHPYVDDGDLPFASYRYALSASVANGVRVQDAPVTDLLRRVADRLQRAGGMGVLMVLDLQYRDRPGAAPAPAQDPAPMEPALDGAQE